MQLSLKNHTSLVALSIVFVFMLLAAIGCSTDMPKNAPEAEVESRILRIVSLNGSITELLFSLGEGHRVVGIDITSTYPAEALDTLIQLGHTSRLNTEALLALQPDLVLVDSASMAASDVLPILEGAGIEVMLLPIGQHLSASLSLAKQLQAVLQLPELALSKLQDQLHNDSIALTRYLDNETTPRPPRTLFLYARGPNRILVGGSGTTADAMLTHAGAINSAGVEGFTSLTPESIVASQPEALLLFESGLTSLDGVEGLARVPGITASPAYKEQRIVAMDGHYLLSFGPRAAEAALVLAKALRGESSPASFSSKAL